MTLEWHKNTSRLTERLCVRYIIIWFFCSGILLVDLIYYELYSCLKFHEFSPICWMLLNDYIYMNFKIFYLFSSFKYLKSSSLKFYLKEREYNIYIHRK